MYKKRKVLGLIPARGGSKGLPKKNILALGGKPLIAWTIGQALASKYLDAVVVSTDSKEIARIATKYGALTPFIRPEKLATDSASSMEVVYHALDFLAGQGQKYDYVALLEPTSPLRKSNDLDNAIKTLIDAKNKADSLISLGQIALEHPIYAKKITKNKYIRPYFETEAKYSRRQDLPIAYFPYGVIYLSKVSSLRNTNTFYQKRTIAYFIERWQNFEIDDEIDLMLVEKILSFRNNKIKIKGGC